jgi:membrane protein DedA with SNARE-associated domain
MHFTDFSSAVQWVINHGYFLMLVGMIVEGPIVTAAAAFAVAKGYFNIEIVFLLSLLGDVLADSVFYSIGYIGHVPIVKKIGPKFGLSDKRLQILQDHLHKHGRKTLAAIKLNPITPLPGLMLVGAVRMPWRKFISTSLLITVPKTILFLIIGYYFSKAFDGLAVYFQKGAYAFIVLAIVGVVIFFGYRYISTKLSTMFDKN